MRNHVIMSAMPSAYVSWNMGQLRSELKSRGAKLSGRKSELIERLESYDRNYNFGNTSQEIIEEYDISLPEETEYKDLHSGTGFPKVTRGNIDDYLNGLNKSLGKESIDLVNDRFLLFIKVARKDGTYFVKSQCRASMRKHVTYNIDILISSDGVVDECQCDCGAGMGPDAHCKHVNALLYALSKFGQSGEVLTEITCTQRLQTFHHSKSYKGSPLKACTFEKNSVGRKSVIFDPRPEALRGAPSYPGYFRNTCLNFPNIGHTPIVQLYPPANTYAIAHDHDYTGDQEEMFLQSIKVENIDKCDAEEIEESTRRQAKCNFWKELRCTRLNSSNFGRICKATSDTDHDLLARTLTVHNPVNSKAIRHGRKYESVAIKAYCQHTGRSVHKCGSFVSITHPYLAASPDGILDGDGIIEVKCPFTAKGKVITHNTVPYLHEDMKGNLTLKLSDQDSTRAHNYYYQVQGQLFCSEKQYCDFVVYTVKDVKIIRIERDSSFIDQMVNKLQSFYDCHFRSAVLAKYFYKNYYKFTFDY